MSGELNQSGDAYVESLALDIRRRLERVQQRTSSEANILSPCIFRFSPPLTGLVDKAEFPEIVSVGPFHRGSDKLKEYEEHKWSLHGKFLNRATRGMYNGLNYYLYELKRMEERARACYSEIIPMSSADFVEMMLLDGCFVIEIFIQLCLTEVTGNSSVVMEAWRIPTLLGDLLKMENQLPFFVLETLFEGLGPQDGISKRITSIALGVLNLVSPRPLDIETINKFTMDLETARKEPKHLLDLYRLSLIPSDEIINIIPEKYFPSDESIQSVTQLRLSGIKFKPRNGANFFCIDFRKRVLEIPPIVINDFLSIVLINCVAYEQCQQFAVKYFTDYVAFMNSLMKESKDVKFLSQDGIIRGWFKTDLFVVPLFTRLRENTAFNIDHCYLRKQIRELETYYSSDWAYMKRTYFRSPWALISVVYAFIILVLTMVQTATSIYQSYKH